jgi:hypothetical protein
MKPVWHVEQSLTGSHTKVILVNTATTTMSALGEVHEDSQNRKDYKAEAISVKYRDQIIERGTTGSLSSGPSLYLYNVFASSYLMRLCLTFSDNHHWLCPRHS